MDLRLFGRVIRRFKWIVLLGFIIAAGLAFLAVFRVSTNGKLSYRQSALYSATTRVGITQKGFPWGRLFAQQPAKPNTPTETPAQEAQRLGIPIADPNRFTSLALLYSQLATGDEVRHLARQYGTIKGEVTATPLTEGDAQILLPMIDITAISNSPKKAILLSLRTANGLRRYIVGQQTASNVADVDRVVIVTVQLPKAHVYRGRPKTLPIVIFLAVMLATIGFAFLLENMRPRARRAEVEPDSSTPDTSTPPATARRLA